MPLLRDARYSHSVCYHRRWTLHTRRTRARPSDMFSPREESCELWLRGGRNRREEGVRAAWRYINTSHPLRGMPCFREMRGHPGITHATLPGLKTTARQHPRHGWYHASDGHSNNVKVRETRDSERSGGRGLAGRGSGPPRQASSRVHTRKGWMTMRSSEWMTPQRQAAL
eukprot:936795-Rhodomonas_salina.1